MMEIRMSSLIVLNAPALVYENISQRARVAVRLRGRPGNTRGVGARISLIEAAFTQSQEIIGGGRYLSGDQAQRTFRCHASIQ